MVADELLKKGRAPKETTDMVGGECGEIDLSVGPFPDALIAHLADLIHRLGKPVGTEFAEFGEVPRPIGVGTPRPFLHGAPRGPVETQKPVEQEIRVRVFDAARVEGFQHVIDAADDP